jgi:hypothetical protein
MRISQTPLLLLQQQQIKRFSANPEPPARKAEPLTMDPGPFSCRRISVGMGSMFLGTALIETLDLKLKGVAIAVGILSGIAGYLFARRNEINDERKKQHSESDTTPTTPA